MEKNEAARPYGLEHDRLEAEGDDANAVVQVEGGQWLICSVDCVPFPEDKDCDPTPWSALAMAQFITDCCNSALNDQGLPRQAAQEAGGMAVATFTITNIQNLGGNQYRVSVTVHSTAAGDVPMEFTVTASNNPNALGAAHKALDALIADIQASPRPHFI